MRSLKARAHLTRITRPPRKYLFRQLSFSYRRQQAHTAIHCFRHKYGSVLDLSTESGCFRNVSADMTGHHDPGAPAALSAA
jgi:hypothetical protein